VATRTVLPRVDKIFDERETVTIEVKLSGQDLRNIRRILGEKFEPLEDAWLVVRVKKKEQ
jgi:hypothetical protein